MVTSPCGRFSSTTGGIDLRFCGGLRELSRQMVMWSFAGCLPVWMDARVGEHTGDAE